MRTRSFCRNPHSRISQESACTDVTGMQNGAALKDYVLPGECNLSLTLRSPASPSTMGSPCSKNEISCGTRRMGV